jgi:hypothetical protein
MHSKWTIIKLAFRALWRTFTDAGFRESIEPLLALPAGEPAPPLEPAKPSGEPLRLLALLQRDGRLIDFLIEDIEAYPDAQIGAAVRDIHRQCGKVIREHLDLEPVLPEHEEAQVTIPAGFDPATIRLTGNVTGAPPFTGILKHRGWRVKEIKSLPKSESQDEFLLMPAEVELA